MAIEDEQVSDVRTKLLENAIGPAPLASYQGPADSVENYRFWGVTATALQDSDKIKIVVEYCYNLGLWREFDSFYVGSTSSGDSVDRVYRITRIHYRARIENESEISTPVMDFGYIKGGN